MKYRNIEKYKYQLAERTVWKTGIKGYSFKTPYIEFYPDGTMVGLDGYLSDGPSGLTVDTPDVMYPAFGHDIIYECIRRGLLPPELRDVADRLLHQWMLENNVPEIRANYWYDAVHLFAGKNAIVGSETKDKVLEV